jgi:iron complex outermembrane receptor protein
MHVTRIIALALAALPVAPFVSSLAAQDASLPASDSQAAAQNDEIVKMEAFNVSTTIGSYHEETSSMATKVPTDLKELSSSLQILNSNAIQDRNAVSLQDVYSYVVGATQSQNNTNGFSFRGISNTGTFTQNIEYDGLQGGIFNHSALSAADVADLEFLKGPNSVLYGQMKPGGLLNIVTKSPENVEKSDIRFTFATYASRYNTAFDTNSYGVSFDTTGPIDAGKHWLYRVIVDTEDDKNFRRDDDRLLQIYPSLTYQWSTDTYFTVKVEVGQDKRQYDENLIPLFTTTVNGGPQAISYGRAATWTTAPLNTKYQEPSDVSRDRGDALSTYFQKRWGDNWTYRLQTRSVWHTDSVYDLSTNNNSIFVGPTYLVNGKATKLLYGVPTSQIARQFNHNTNGHRYNFFDTNVYGTVGPQSFRNTLLIGVGGGKEFYNNQRWAFGPNVTPAVSVLNPVLGQSAYPNDGTSPQSPRDTLNNLGEYVSDQITVASRVHVTAGLRHDQQESHGDADNFSVGINPKIPYQHQFVTSLTYQVGVVGDITKNFSAYFSDSTSDNPNVLTDVDAQGDSSFAPEKGQQYEGGLRYETDDHHFYASAAYYWLERTNVLVATTLTVPGSGQAIWRLDGAQHSEGFEFESEWQPLPYWQLQGGVALGKAFIAQSVANPQTVGDDLANAPRASGNLWTRYNVPGGALKGLGAGLGVIYSGKQWGGDPTSTVYYSLPGYTRVDLAGFYTWKRYNFRMSVTNLFDRKYFLSGQTQFIVIPGEARKLTLSVDLRF